MAPVPPEIFIFPLTVYPASVLFTALEFDPMASPFPNAELIVFEAPIFTITLSIIRSLKPSPAVEPDDTLSLFTFVVTFKTAPSSDVLYQ